MVTLEPTVDELRVSEPGAAVMQYSTAERVVPR